MFVDQSVCAGLSYASHLVIHAVQEPRHHWKYGGLESLHVVRKQTDIALEKANPPAVADDHRLEIKNSRLSHQKY